MSIRAQITTFFSETLWQTDLNKAPRWQAWGMGLLRALFVLVRDLTDGQLTLRAMSLVYTTLLSLIPLLAVSFSVLKAFGVHNKIEPFLLNVLQPMGEKGVEITERVLGFVKNVNAGVLGSLGLVLLLYTVVSLIQKIERAFNYTWRVKTDRSFVQRFSDYLSIVLVGPVLIFSALGITASFMHSDIVRSLSELQPFGELIRLAGRMLPYLLIIAAFSFFYTLVPNTKVRVRSALVGGVVAGVLWETVGWAFASFVVSSAKYTVIYSAFATLIMFMIWLYLAWLILLVGASVAFYHQHPEFLGIRDRRVQLSPRLVARCGLQIMFLAGQRFYEQAEAWTLEGLARELRLPIQATEPLVLRLVETGLLQQTAQDPPRLVPARPLETTSVKTVLDAMRDMAEDRYLNPKRLPAAAAVERTLEEEDHAVATAVRARSIKDLVYMETEPD